MSTIREEKGKVVSSNLLEQTNETRYERFTALYTKFSGKVQRIILKYTHNQEITEDLTQEVFLCLYQKCDIVTKSDQQIDFWLYRTAQRKVIDSWRRQQRIAFVPLDGTGEEEDHPLAEQVFAPDDVEEEVLAREVQTELDTRCAVFPIVTRCMITLARRGYSRKEIGGILGLKDTAIKTRWYRVIHFLCAEAKVA